MKKNKILILVPDLSKPGGIANYYNAIKNYLSKEVDFFYRGTKNNSKSKYFDFTYDLIRFIFILSSNKYSIYIVNNSTGRFSFFRDYLFIRLIRLFSKKYIIFFRGWSNKSAELILNNIEYKRSIINSDAIIVLANEFKYKFREQGIKQPIYIETTTFEDELINNIYGENTKKLNNGLKLLFLARVEKEKGIFELLEAYKLLKPKYSDITLTIAGDGSILNDVKLKVIKDNIKDISFSGYVRDEEKVKIFLDSDIYIFPSYSEGMPNSVLEAMAFGLPVVARAVGGLKDFFEDGKMGFITDSKKPVVFANMIEKLIINKDLIHEISDYNRKFAKKNFIASNVAKRVENIYLETLEGRAIDRSWQDVI